MSAHKNIDKLCAVILAFTVLIAFVFCCGGSLGIQSAANVIGYENRIFDTSRVHKIDIVMDDWNSFIESCESEEYAVCSLVIDGEAFKNVAIRAKGNTSLSSVKSMGSSRYSFKIEFDHFNDSTTYHGLDKLCLNNIIQDNTYMKDYLAYTLMNSFGVDSPLCSYADISVNGEEWGLYLAVESIEDSFLMRNYGAQYGELYKPDSMSFGGGRGNGRDFDMNNFMNKNESDSTEETSENNTPQSFDFSGENMPDFRNGKMPEDFDFSDKVGKNGGGFGGMGSDDVKLKYSDDNFESYSNIFDNAKTEVTTADKKRLIESLKAISEQGDISSSVDIEEVIRYFVVHNFLVNGDSYTGSMIHNYYLYEENGQLSMIPWDYNLAFGTFQGNDASSSVNSPIDTPVSGEISDRPMIAWIFNDEQYTEQYHQLFREFINSIDLPALISETAEMIDEYVKNDATKFCTYEEFQTGVSAISEFCRLRTECVKGQLDGTIPSTSEGQKANSSALIDTSSLNISDIGTMNMGGGRMSFGNQDLGAMTDNSTNPQNLEGTPPAGFNGEMPSDFDPNNIPEGFSPDNMPGDFDFNNKPPNAAPETDDNTNNSSETNAGQPQNNRSDRAAMSDFPPMNGGTASGSSSAILLVLSAVILLGGIGFAIKFKR